MDHGPWTTEHDTVLELRCIILIRGSQKGVLMEIMCMLIYVYAYARV